MIVNQMRTLFEYNEWAWKQVFASVKKLDETAYRAQRPLFGQTSIHDLLVHCLAAEYTWLSRCLGHSPRALFDPNDFADFTAVRQHWAVVNDDWNNFLRGLTGADLSRLVAYQNTRGDAFALSQIDILQHVINHATEHRSQITPFLFQSGVPTPSLDYAYFRLQS